MDEFLLKFFPSVYGRKHTAKESDYYKYDSQILQFFSSSLYIVGLLPLIGSKYSRIVLYNIYTYLYK
jgi:hypothetical protein